MAIAEYIPELWMAEIQMELDKMLVARRIVNTNLVANDGGKAKKGSVFHIIGAANPTTQDYPASANITYGAITDTDTTLTIDVDKVSAITIEDHEKGAGVDWQGIFQKKMAYELLDLLDVDIMSEYAAATTENYETGTTPWQLGATGADVPALLASLNKQMNDLKLPQEGRYFIMPTICKQAFDLYMTGRLTDFGDEVLRTGAFGQLQGINLHVSQNCQTVSTTVHGLAGVYGEGIALKPFVDPSFFEVLRSQGRYADLIRVRAMWGIKTYKADRILDVNLNTTLLA